MSVITLLLISSILFVLGAAVGSFLNVIIYRTMTGESWVWGWSHCEGCKKRIRWYDNIPIISYVILRAKCRDCQEQIALSHPVIELLTGLLFVWWYWGASFFFRLTEAPFSALQPLFWLSVGVLLVLIFVADILYLLIPDIAVVLLFILTTAYRLALAFSGIMRWDDFFRSCIASVGVFLFFAFLWWVTKGKGMGLGDVKLVGPLTLLMGWPKVMVGLFLAFFIGAIAGLLLIAARKRTFGQTIPFGPFLVIGTSLSLLIGDELLQWYLRLLY